MEGYDADWVEAEDRRFANYTNLREGRYRFRVQASVGDGTWAPYQASLDLRILAPWYRSWWAYGLYMVVVGFTVYGYNAYRVRLERAKADRER
ncbi:triple tyrosine motif-containing protein, partial [Arthrospira platensis SPKY1]|nr:triple tyrosine motif-containing protein [Arthrospira platensis SPKY1]